MPNLYIIAGPNGAGKTTSAKVLVPEFMGAKYFINADEIARSLNPLNVEKAALQAGKLMLRQMDELINTKQNFAFETTLSARSYVRLIELAKKLGYKISLIFLYLESAQLALKRVKLRVKEGGHNIPEITVLRRYEAGLKNFFKLYQPQVNNWFFYNSSAENPELIAAQKGKESIIYKKQFWQEVKDKYDHR